MPIGRKSKIENQTNLRDTYTWNFLLVSGAAANAPDGNEKEETGRDTKRTSDVSVDSQIRVFALEYEGGLCLCSGKLFIFNFLSQLQ